MRLTNKSGGLNPEPAEELSERLNVLLANYQLFLQNIRSLFWNPRLRIFMDFGGALGKLRKIMQQDAEVIANSILLLGHAPSSSAMDFMTKGDIASADSIEDLDTGLKVIINNTVEILDHVEEVIDFISDWEEDGALELLDQLEERLTYAHLYFTQMRSTYMN